MVKIKCYNTWIDIFGLVVTIVKPKQTGSCGRGIINEHMSNTNTILNIKCYGTNSICNIILSITKKTARIRKFGIVDDGLSSALNCQFVLVLLL